MILEKLKEALDNDPRVQKISNGKEWVSNLSLCKEVMRMINLTLNDYIKENPEVLKKARNIESKNDVRSSEKKNIKTFEDHIKEIESHIKNQGIYTCISHMTPYRWWEKKSIKRPTKIPVRYFLLFLNKERIIFDAEDPLESETPRSIGSGNTIKNVLERIAGNYQIYSRWPSSLDLILVSVLHISKSHTKHILSINRGHEIGDETFHPKISVFNETMLLIRVEGERQIFITIYKGQQRRPKVMKGIAISHNENNEPFSSKVILVRTEELLKPQRLELVENELIHQYLYQPNNLIQLGNHRSFNNSDLKIEQSHSNYKKYHGIWDLYCNIGNYRNDEGKDDHLNRYVGEVVKSTFEIFIDEKTKECCCCLQADHLSDKPLSGFVLENAGPPSFIYCKLTSSENEIQVSFSFHIGTGMSPKNIIGLFTTLSSDKPVLSSGIAILCSKNTANSYTGTDIKKERRINNFLSPIDKNRLEPPIIDYSDIIKEKSFKDCPYQGLYKVYSYGRKRSAGVKCITIGVLEINSNYKVRHKLKAGEEHSYGIAEMGNNSLVVHLRNNQTERYGAFFMTVKKENPKPDHDFIYTGIFAGYDRNDNFAVGSRLILEYLPSKSGLFEDIKPERIDLYSEEYWSLREGIRKSLTGRIHNFIGFFKKNNIFSFRSLDENFKKDIQLGNVLFESACYNAERGKISNALDLMRKAILHGFIEIDKFENELNDFVLKSKITESDKERILSDEDYNVLKELVRKST